MIFITKHAIDRMQDMGVSAEEVREAVKEPEIEYRGSPPHPTDRRCCIRGQIVVVTTPGKDRVITVLWHRKEGRE